MMFGFAMLVSVSQIFGQPIENGHGRVIIQPCTNEQSIELRIENITHRCQIQLTDGLGRGLFSDAYRTKSGYAKKLNLSGLEPGKYLVTVLTDEWIYDQAVEVYGSDVFVPEEENNWYVFPKLEVSNESIRVVTSEAQTLRADEMVLFNKGGQEIFSYKMKNRNPKIDITFDITKLDAGEYTVALFTPAKTIKKEVHRK